LKGGKRDSAPRRNEEPHRRTKRPTWPGLDTHEELSLGTCVSLWCQMADAGIIRPHLTN
jgi:hypothetical protein